MPVTEFAFAHLATPLEPLLPAMASGIRVQDAWHRRQFPDLPSSNQDRGVLWFVRADDPSRLLVTVRWETVDAHLAWMRSEENASLMAELDHNFVMSDTVLLHTEGDVLGRLENNDTTVNPLVSVSRLFVDKDKKEDFAKKWDKVRGSLHEPNSTRLVGCGWRVDLEEDAKHEEFMLVCCAEDINKVSGYNQIGNSTEKAEQHVYRRMQLE